MGRALVADILSGQALIEQFKRSLEGLMNKKILTLTLMVLAFTVGVAAEAKTFRYSTSGDILGLPTSITRVRPIP
jgi:hypothetical protein